MPAFIGKFYYRHYAHGVGSSVSRESSAAHLHSAYHTLSRRHTRQNAAASSVSILPAFTLIAAREEISPAMRLS